MANQKRCDIQGLGDVCLTFSDGYKLTLRNVRYVPDLNHNLMSCAALEEEGLEGRWGKGIMKIMKGSLTVFKADRRRNLYVCTVDYDILAASVTDFDKTSLWHKRLGHISQKGLELLQKEGVLIDKIEKLKFCDECVMGKQHKVQFPASQNPNPVSSSSILDYVHADVWGPSNVSTHGGNKYFLSIIDNFSRKVFVFLMKHKSDVFENFRKWKILVENQTGKKLKVLRTDNGLEFYDSQDKNNDNLDLTFNKVEDNQQGEENEEEPGTDFFENSNSEGLDDYLLARDRNRREPRIPARYNDFHIALNVEPNEPSSVEEALKSENSKNWLSAMAEEMKSLKDNNTWVLVPKPKSCSVVDCKWIFKIKEEDTSKRFKARLVAKGFTQKEGIDYTEIFSPVVKYTTVRIILALTAHFNWELKQMDVKTAFLHASHYQLSKEQCPKTEKEKEKMKNIPYSNAIGSIMFLMVCTRPDIAYSISCLSRYMSNAGLPHWEALKWLLRYLNGSANRGLIFSKCAKGVDLTGYVDSIMQMIGIVEGTHLKNGDDDKTLTQSLDRFPETVLVQGGVFLRAELPAVVSPQPDGHFLEDHISRDRLLMANTSVRSDSGNSDEQKLASFTSNSAEFPQCHPVNSGQPPY
ncbi:UNVERIFIED_CONTAM: Retrovirus-related Pol polyprotein from transposon TNT 1-94 [Sesamum angustifolium]|uniref:Retrovirus-related Pol polyprotein from transposon TNT 1-94 n=1 Tax=Sesamum angustifolium TaxID=2727405 RepID=A0AAW2PV81_9LAMI